MNNETEKFLAHHGVKGMKWGVRKAKRLERVKRVGKGKGSAIDKVRVHSMANPIDLVKTGGLNKAAARKGARMQSRKNRINSGKATAADVLIEVGSIRYTDLLPSISR